MTNPQRYTQKQLEAFGDVRRLVAFATGQDVYLQFGKALVYVHTDTHKLGYISETHAKPTFVAELDR